MRGAVWARRRFRMASNQRCKVSMTTYNLSIAREEGRTPVPPHIAHGICLLITHKGHGNCLVIPLDYDAGDKNRVSFFLSFSLLYGEGDMGVYISLTQMPFPEHRVHLARPKPPQRGHGRWDRRRTKRPRRMGGDESRMTRLVTRAPPMKPPMAVPGMRPICKCGMFCVT